MNICDDKFRQWRVKKIKKGEMEMSDFRCPFYYYDGSWRCVKVSGCLSLHDYDTYCTDKYRYVQCPYYRD